MLFFQGQSLVLHVTHFRGPLFWKHGCVKTSERHDTVVIKPFDSGHRCAHRVSGFLLPACFFVGGTSSCRPTLRVRMSGARWGQEASDDIICGSGGEIMLGIRVGASLGWGLAELAYILVLSCFVLTVPEDNGSGPCLEKPPTPQPQRLCVHLFPLVTLPFTEFYQACYLSLI